MEHIHPVEDNDLQFNIDVETRTITHPSPESLILVRGDHNSERFSFEMDRYIDGHDTMLCDKVQVHYINIDGETSDVTSSDVYTVDDMALKNGDNEKIVCSWLIANTATLYAGTLSFALRFSCTKDSKPVYVWNTAPYSGVVVSNGVNSSEAVVSQYGDVLDQWYAEFLNAGATGVRMVNDAIPAAVEEVVEESKKRITADTLSAKDILVQERGYHDDRVMSQDTVTQEFDSLWNTMESSIVEAVNETRAIASSLESKFAEAANPGTAIKLTKLDPVSSSGGVDIFEISPGEKYRVYGIKSLNSWPVKASYTYGDDCQELSIPYNPYSEYVVFQTFINPDATAEFKLCMLIDGNYFDAVAESLSYDGYYIDGATAVYHIDENAEYDKYVVTARGIASIDRTGGDRIRNTYTISFDDGSTYDFDVPSGIGIDEVELFESGYGFDTYMLRFTDGNGYPIRVPNVWAYGARKTVFGTSIKVDDVSPEAHKVKLSVESKNLFNIGLLSTTTIEESEYGTRGYISKIDAATGSITITTEDSHTSNGYTICGKTLGELCSTLKDGDTFTISAISSSVNKCIYLGAPSAMTVFFGQSYVVTEDMLNSSVILYGLIASAPGRQGTGDCVISNIQIERGTVSTEYTPYTDAYPDVYVNGTYYASRLDGVVSNVAAVSPSMEVAFDGDDGYNYRNVILKMEYLQDINKVLEKAGVSEPINTYTKEESDALLLGLGREFDVKLDGIHDDIQAIEHEFSKCFTITESVNLFDKSAVELTTGLIMSNGSVVANSNISHFLFPVEVGKTYTFPIYYSSIGYSAAYNTPCYNAAGEYLGSMTGTPTSDNAYLTLTHNDTVYSTAVWADVPNAGVKYIKLNVAVVANVSPNLDTFMIVEGDTYPSEYHVYGAGGVSLNPEVRIDYGTDPLYGTKVVFTGDSICAGTSDETGVRGWAQRIGEKYSMSWQNKGINGATITSGVSGSSGCIADTDFGDNPDYIIIEGGTNDADLIGSADDFTPEKYGSYTLGQYTAEFDKTTFCGAVEHLFKRVTTNYPGAKIGFIIAHKMGYATTAAHYDAETSRRRLYFETIIKLCKKWGIPYIDLWEGSYLCPMNPAHNTANTNLMYVGDYQHLASKGYNYITPMIEAWMKTL